MGVLDPTPDTGRMNAGDREPGNEREPKVGFIKDLIRIPLIIVVVVIVVWLMGFLLDEHGPDLGPLSPTFENVTVTTAP
jgi:hypothetical protein